MSDCSVRRLGIAVAMAALLVAQGAAAVELTLEVAAGDSDRIGTPVCAPLVLPPELTAAAAEGTLVAETEGPGGKAPAQVVLGKGKGDPTTLWWLLTLKAGQAATFTATVAKGKPEGKAFQFQDMQGQHLDLLFDGRKVTRLEYALDPKKHFPRLRYVKDDQGKKVPHPEGYNATDGTSRLPGPKPFTHVFDAAGERVITSPGGEPFPHHRGIFLGYKVGVGGKQYDFWHCGNVWQRLERFTGQEAGPVLGRMTAVIKWEIKADTPVITEERTVTVYRQSEPGVLLDFVSTLRSEAGDLDLGGDAEHAGCQFRPHFDVANPENRDHTRYVHPPGMKPGGRGTKDMPWSTLSYALGDSRFNVAHLNHPDNPKGTIYSAYRYYGRFGAYARAKLPADQPLTLRYRIYVREGQDAALTVEEAQRLYADFATPPKVAAK